MKDFKINSGTVMCCGAAVAGVFAYNGESVGTVAIVFFIGSTCGIALDAVIHTFKHFKNK